MKLYKAIRTVAGVDGVGCPDLEPGDEAEMTEQQARARVGLVELIEDEVEEIHVDAVEVDKEAG